MVQNQANAATRSVSFIFFKYGILKSVKRASRINAQTLNPRDAQCKGSGAEKL